MNGYDWFLVGIFALSGLYGITRIGKYREPLTPNWAAVGVAINAAIIVGLVVTR